VAALKSGNSSNGSDSSHSPLPITPCDVPIDGFGDLDSMFLGDGYSGFSGKSITPSRMFAVMFVSGCIYFTPLEAGAGDSSVYHEARVAHEDAIIVPQDSGSLFWYYYYLMC
jgi:hypothetical protein